MNRGKDGVEAHSYLTLGQSWQELKFEVNLHFWPFFCVACIVDSDLPKYFDVLYTVGVFQLYFDFWSRFLRLENLVVLKALIMFFGLETCSSRS